MMSSDDLTEGNCQITPELNKQFSHSLLIQRGKAYQREGKMKEALGDIKSALSINRNKEAEECLYDILGSDRNPKEGLLDKFRLEKGTSRKLEMAKRMIMFSKDLAVCEELLLNGFLGEISDTKETEIQHLLVVVLSNISSHAKHSNLFLKNTEKLNLHSFFNAIIQNTDQELAMDSFAAAIGHSKDDSWKSFLSYLYSNCKTNTQPLPHYRCLLKLLGREAIVYDLIKDNQAVLITLFGKDETDFKSLTVAIFARIFDSLSTDRKHEIGDSLFTLISKLIDSKCPASAFRALSAIIQADNNYGSILMLREGFLDGILDELETSDIQLCILETLSIACSIPDFQKLLADKGSALLITYSRQQLKKEIQLLSSLILIKIMQVCPIAKEELMGSGSITLLFRKVLDSAQVDSQSKVVALEALAYLTVQGNMKERVSNDSSLIKSLRVLASNDRASNYAIAVIIYNLTVFEKELTEEEKQVKKLHELAKSSAEQDPMNSSIFVLTRISKLRSLVPSLVKIKSDSLNMQAILAETLLSFATVQELRGMMVQSGCPRILIQISNALESKSGLSAAQALAKIAITADPTLAFSGQMSIEVIRPMIRLLEKGSSLAQFEGLMALTNLSGMNDAVRLRIIQLKGLDLIKNLQFSSIALIKRAATEALCNMIYHPTVFASYADKNCQLLQIMIALSDDEEFETRRAASGAVAILSSEPRVIPLILEHVRFQEIFLDLLKSENPELLHRGLEIVKNIGLAGRSKDLGRNIIQRVLELSTGGIAQIKPIALETYCKIKL